MQYFFSYKLLFPFALYISSNAGKGVLELKGAVLRMILNYNISLFSAFHLDIHKLTCVTRPEWFL